MHDRNGKAWVGIILIILGAIFLLKNIHILPYELHRIIFSWPSILLIVGIIILSKSRNNALGVILIAFGGISLILRFFDYPFREFFYDFWPVMLIALGLYILYRRKDFRSHGSSCCSTDEKEDGFIESNEDYLDETIIFSGVDKKIKSNNFKGGKITALFGGGDIDLYDCQLAEGENVLDLECIFGGVDIIIPKDWQVVMKVTAIFGGIDDQRRKEVTSVYQEGKVLVIKGLVLFGGGDIKN